MSWLEIAAAFLVLAGMLGGAMTTSWLSPRRGGPRHWTKPLGNAAVKKMRLAAGRPWNRQEPYAFYELPTKVFLWSVASFVAGSVLLILSVVV